MCNNPGANANFTLCWQRRSSLLSISVFEIWNQVSSNDQPSKQIKKDLLYVFYLHRIKQFIGIFYAPTFHIHFKKKFTTTTYNENPYSLTLQWMPTPSIKAAMIDSCWTTISKRWNCILIDILSYNLLSICILQYLPYMWSGCSQRKHLMQCYFKFSFYDGGCHAFHYTT